MKIQFSSLLKPLKVSCDSATIRTSIVYNMNNNNEINRSTETNILKLTKNLFQLLKRSKKSKKSADDVYLQILQCA